MTNKVDRAMVPDIDELHEQLSLFLTNDTVNTVFILSDEVYSLSLSDEEFCKQLNSADILLASNSLMMREFLKNNVAAVVELDNNKPVALGKYEYNAFDEVIKVLASRNSTIFVLTQDEKEMEKCNMMLKMDAPDIKSWEKCAEDIQASSETILNEINGIAPDVLICSFDSPLQEKWILGNKDKMNTRMVLGIGPGVSKAKKNKASVFEHFRTFFKKK